MEKLKQSLIGLNHLNKHWWYTVDSGMGIRCDKCDRYANMQHDDNFTEIEGTEDCPINSEEQHYDKDTI